MGEDGFYVQEYTIHVSPPIFPQEGLSLRQQAEDMMYKNYEAWKTIYEEEYHIPLSYTTRDNMSQLKGFVPDAEDRSDSEDMSSNEYDNGKNEQESYQAENNRKAYHRGCLVHPWTFQRSQQLTGYC